jgi:hypothetical protein
MLQVTAFRGHTIQVNSLDASVHTLDDRHARMQHCSGGARSTCTADVKQSELRYHTSAPT